MPHLTVIAGVNGTGKSSFRGVLTGLGVELGTIIDADQIARTEQLTDLEAGRKAVHLSDMCLSYKKTFMLETTLSGARIPRLMRQAKAAGYQVSMYYIGLNSEQESIVRISNRVQHGGHNIPSADVIRRFERRGPSLAKALPYCDNVYFFDNTNGFEKIAEWDGRYLHMMVDNVPQWMVDISPFVTSAQVTEHHVDSSQRRLDPTRKKEDLEL